MSQQQLLIDVAAALEKHGIGYMLTGSIASSLYGEPRLTHDIDIIVQVSTQDAVKLAESFPPPRYYLDDKESLVSAVGRKREQFQDALRVFEVQRADLDQDYCEAWAEKLGATALWARLLGEAAT